MVAKCVPFVGHETEDSSNCCMQSILPVGGRRGNITTTYLFFLGGGEGLFQNFLKAFWTLFSSVPSKNEYNHLWSNCTTLMHLWSALCTCIHTHSHTWIFVSDVQINVFVDIMVFKDKFKNHILMFDTLCTHTIFYFCVQWQCDITSENPFQCCHLCSVQAWVLKC